MYRSYSNSEKIGKIEEKKKQIYIGIKYSVFYIFKLQYVTSWFLEVFVLEM